MHTFQLRPLNVLIGPNRSGKTNFLDFLHLLSEAGRQQLPSAISKRGGVVDVISWSGEQRLAWGLGFEFDVENAPANETGIYYVAEIAKKHFSFFVSRENFKWTFRHPSTNYDQSQRELAIFASDSNGTSAHDTLTQIGYKVDNSNLTISQLRDSANFPISARLRHELANITVHRFFDTTLDAP
ncbi:MAG: AAA family ATPase, partial [bacterium]